MELVQYHTTEGVYMALVVKRGHKWLHLLYMSSPRLTKVNVTEERYFKSLGEATPKQIKQFNASARRAGYSKKKNLVSS